MSKKQIASSVQPKSVQIDFNEAPLQRWFGEITRNSTRILYKSAWKSYATYTGKTATELLDEATEDMKRDPKEKKGIVLQRLLGFYQWLCTEYPVVSRGYGQHGIIRKGLRPKTAFMKVQVMRSFYGTFDIPVRMKGKSRLPRPRVYNKRDVIKTALDVKLLCDHARLPRDRAIILTMFQGGMDVSTLCSMKFQDVKEGLQKNEHPLKLSLYREKAGVDYYTYLGRDATSAIKAYLNDLKSRGIILKNGDPLFVKQITSRNPEPMTTDLVQKFLRESAMRSGLVDENLNGKDQNPASPHALREAFGSIMVNKGVPDTIVDFWLGHTLGEMAQAYKGVKEEELKRMYLEREQYISISAPETGKYEEELGGLQTQVNSLLAENLRLKEENMDLKKRVSGIEDWMPSIKEVVNWHKEIKVEQQLEKESRKFHPYPPNGWREERKREILEGE